jgi:hypothetical protein
MRDRTSRTVVLAMAGLIVVILAFFSSYTSALGKPTARHVPVAVAAPSAVLTKLDVSGQFRAYPVTGLPAARAMVEDRAAYGALVLPRTGPATLLVAGGAGHAVEAVLTQLGQQQAGIHGAALHTVDVAPTSPNDPNGSVEFYCVIFLGIGAAVGGTMLARTLGPVRGTSSALRRLGLVLLYAGVLSVVVTAFADGVYGALVGHFWPLFLTMWLFVVAECLAVGGFAALAGPLAAIPLIVVLVLLGNPSAGGAVPRPLMNGFFAALNPVLPPGAALSALRGVQYFGNRGMGTALLCLAIWVAAGLGLLGAAALRRERVAPS